MPQEASLQVPFLLDGACACGSTREEFERSWEAGVPLIQLALLSIVLGFIGVWGLLFKYQVFCHLREMLFYLFQISNLVILIFLVSHVLDCA